MNMAEPSALSIAVRAGLREDQQVEYWDLSRRSNFNTLFLGASGSGKTFRIQHMIAPLVAAGITFHILDVKDDFSYESFSQVGLENLITPEHINDIDLSYVDGDSGINILQFSRIPSGGGVYMAVQEFIEIAKMFNSAMSQKMAGYLSDILFNLYEQKGIQHEDQSTWANPAPTVADLLKHIDKIISSVKSGLHSTVLDDLEKVRGKAKAASSIKDEEKFNEAVDQAKELLSKYAQEVCTSKTRFYSSFNLHTLGSLRDTVKNMVACNLFTRPPARRQRGVINRYRIASLSPAHQQIIFRIVLGQVYAMSVMETMNTGGFNPGIPRHIVVLDEGKHAKQVATSDLSPLNRIATEGRGYGCGLMIGVQRMQHVTDDMAANFASRFIVRCDEVAFPDVKKVFGLPPNSMKKLKPRKNMYFYSEDGKFNLVV